MDQDRLRKEKTKNHGPVTRALVIQGSPRGQRGWTDHCLERFIQGLKKEGVAHETVYLHKLDIKHCVGCFNCWFKTPGTCVQKDDMAGLLEKLNEADLWVYAVPLYYYSVTGLFKNFLDRTMPLALPFFNEDSNGITAHPLRYPDPKRVVLLSVCGMPELMLFRSLRDMMALSLRDERRVMVGELLRPSSESMRNTKNFAPAYEKAMQALVEAGRELARQGYVSQTVEQVVSTPFFPDTKDFRDTVNKIMESHLAQLPEKAK